MEVKTYNEHLKEYCSMLEKMQLEITLCICLAKFKTLSEPEQRLIIEQKAFLEALLQKMQEHIKYQESLLQNEVCYLQDLPGRKSSPLKIKGYSRHGIITGGDKDEKK